MLQIDAQFTGRQIFDMPTEAMTEYPRPRYLVMVRALVGDSTMIRDLAMWLHVPKYLRPDYHTHYNKYRDPVSLNLQWVPSEAHILVAGQLADTIFNSKDSNKCGDLQRPQARCVE